MPSRSNRFLIITGVISLVQASVQAAYTAFAIAQHFCVVDFLRTYPLLIFIRILYFNNPSSCDAIINVGESIDGMANQAFVMVQSMPFTTQRTFLINCIGLGLSVIWVIGSILLIRGGTRKSLNSHTHWPWLAITMAITLLDVVALISYANDSFHTRTLTEITSYVSGTLSGAGNVDVDTKWIAPFMALIYSRFFVLLLVNASLMIATIVDCTRLRSAVTSTEGDSDQPTTIEMNEINTEDKESDRATISTPSQVEVTRIPRPGLDQSFRAMKNFLFSRTTSLPEGSARNSINGGRRHRAVNFPEEVQVQPTLENMLAEQRQRLEMATVDTSGRRSPGQGSRVTRTLSYTNLPETTRGRRGTAMELQGQMPWSYMPAATNRMRDQLPPDEDLPPVPLPDYTAIQSARKASVHRAASSLSSMTQKKDYTSFPLTNPTSTLFDVLY